MAWYKPKVSVPSYGLGDLYDDTIGGFGNYFFGEGAILEPVAVVVDPDRTVYSEYFEERLEDAGTYIQDLFATGYDWGDEAFDRGEEITEKAALYGAGVLALYLLLR